MVGAAILFAILAWRLSSSPVSLNFVTPFIERNFSAVDKSYVVRVEDTVLIWDGWRHPADVRARNIKIFSRDGKLLVSLPQVSIGLSMRALVQGRLAVASLGIRRLRASVARFKDGSFTVGLQATEGAEQNIGGLLQGVAHELSRPFGEAEGPLGYLKRVEVTESQLTFDDRQAGIVWHSPRADIVMSRESAGLKTDAAIVIEAQKRRSNLFAQLDYRRQSGKFLLRTRFENLNPSLLARSISGLDDLVNFSMPVTGEVALSVAKDGTLQKIGGGIVTPIGRVEGEFEFAGGGDDVVGLARFEALNVAEIAKRVPSLTKLSGLQVNFNGSIGGKGRRDGRITELEFNLASGAGAVDVPTLWHSPRQVKQIRFKGAILNDFEEIELAEAILDFGGPKIEAEARVERIGGEARLKMNANLFEMPFKSLDTYWPKQLAKTARRWVTTNIRLGYARETNLRLIGWMPAGDFGGFKASSVNGTMRYDGLEVDYWSPLPKIKAAGGTATFSAERFDMVISSGDLQDIKIDQAQVNMFALDTDNEQISVDVLMRGPLRTALQVLDHKPLRYIRKLGLSSDDVTGRSTIRLRMDFPLDTNVDRDQLRVRSSATLKEVAFAPGPFGLDVKDGRFEFKMVDDEMSVRGPVRLNDVATDLTWTEHFSDKRKIRTEYKLRAELTNKDRKALKLAGTEIIDGPMSADMNYAVLRNGQRQLVANVDLTRASFEQPDFGVEKEAGRKAVANLQATLDQKGALKKVSVRLAGDEIGGSGVLAIKPTSDEQWRVHLKKVSIKDRVFDGTVARRDDGVFTGDLQLSQFDIASLMEKRSNANPDKEPVALNVNAKIDRLSWGAKRSLQQVDLALRYDGNHVQSLRVNGGVGNDQTLSIDFQPSPTGYALSVEASNFGETLKALDIAGNVTGGTFKIEAKRPSLKAPMEGNFSVGKYRLRKVPVFARIFQVASLTGIVDAFDQEGLEFETLEGRFAYNIGLLRLEETRTYGSSIGITTEGTLNLNKDTADLGGAVIPAYTVNRILGQIPLLGQILTGGDNEGMFAATYSVKGPLDDPDVSVNPLSAFAPGLLRKFFGVFDSQTGDPDAPELSKPDKSPAPEAAPESVEEPGGP
ncbi:MAG: hypothetical protein CMM48_01850 [Rhodospirillaceae bacterium]|nr:hypothetical protein [Rhodospirillaceae bacterium]